ncbi:MAG: glycosyltransferase family 2 protein [Deltaproteobacteria bacterium]|nr:glycosyltransferase family 2 protein [Deltaproteobacteria bacterium]
MNERQASPTPRLSVVIPVFNEEAILRSAIVELVARLDETKIPYEILIAENGSRDGTVAIAAELAKRYPQVLYSSLGEPNYGKALRQGILRARGEFVICEEIDLCDSEFHRRSLEILETGGAELVIGSKLLEGAEDKRPFMRHLGSIVINQMLRVSLGFKGTDTHGLKAFRRLALLDVVHACLADRDLFASELVIRADRSGIRKIEIPIRVVEKRTPSINLFRRVPNVMSNLARLFYAIRIRG